MGEPTHGDAFRVVPGLEDLTDAQIFGAAPPPCAEDLHPFPMEGAGDTRARDLAAARAAGFARFAPVSEAIAPGTVEADVTAAARLPAPAAPLDGEDAVPADLSAETVDPPPPVITYLAEAGKRIDLEHPFTIDDREVRFILVPPVHMGLLLDFAAGLLPSVFDIAVDLTGENPRVLRALRGTDADALLKAVLAALPADARRSLSAN